MISFCLAQYDLNINCIYKLWITIESTHIA